MKIKLFHSALFMIIKFNFLIDILITINNQLIHKMRVTQNIFPLHLFFGFNVFNIDKTPKCLMLLKL